MILTITGDLSAGLLSYTAMNTSMGSQYVGRAAYKYNDASPIIHIMDSKGERRFLLHVPTKFGWGVSRKCDGRTAITAEDLVLSGLLFESYRGFLRHPIYHLEFAGKEFTGVSATADHKVRSLLFSCCNVPAFIVELHPRTLKSAGKLECYVENTEFIYPAFLTAVWFDTKLGRADYTVVKSGSYEVRRNFLFGKNAMTDEWSEFKVRCLSFTEK